MGLEHQQPEGASVERVLVQQIGDGAVVAEGLRHLDPVDVEHGVVHPMTGELAVRGECFGPLVGVMREHEVGTAAVQVEAVAEDAEAHRRALDMPAGTSRTPRGRP